MRRVLDFVGERRGGRGRGRGRVRNLKDSLYVNSLRQGAWIWYLDIGFDDELGFQVFLVDALKSKHFSQKPTNSNSINDLSFAFNTSCSNPEAFDKSLKEKCRSGNVSPVEARYFFDCLIQRKPTPHMSSFTILFTALVKNKHYEDVISLIRRQAARSFVWRFGILI
ncbi:hypothetical protein QYF36_017210 [Acer negundo]|nr:hypothetical protein QYF36_017210 [Acer negundo]